MDEEEIAQAKLQYQQLRNQQLQQGALSPEQGIKTAQDKLMSAILHNQPKQVFQDIQGIRDAPTSSIFAPVDRANALSTYMGGLAPTILGYAGTQDAYKDAATYYGKGVNIKDGLEEDLGKVDALRKEYNQDRIKAINDDKTLDWATKYRRTKDLATDFANDSRVQTIQGNLASFRNYQDKLQKMLAKGAKDGGITKETYDFLLQKARRDYRDAGGAYNDKGEMNQIDKHFGTPASYVDAVAFNNKIGEGWKADKGTKLRKTETANGGYFYEQETKNGWERVDPQEIYKYASEAMRSDPMFMSHAKQEGEMQAFKTDPEAYKADRIRQAQTKLQQVMSAPDNTITPAEKAQAQKDAQAYIDNLNKLKGKELQNYLSRSFTDKMIDEYATNTSNKFGYTEMTDEQKQGLSSDSSYWEAVKWADKKAQERMSGEVQTQVGDVSYDIIPAGKALEGATNFEEYLKNKGIKADQQSVTSEDGATYNTTIYTDKKGNPVDYNTLQQEFAKNKGALSLDALSKNPRYKADVEDARQVNAERIAKRENRPVATILSDKKYEAQLNNATIQTLKSKASTFNNRQFTSSFDVSQGQRQELTNRALAQNTDVQDSNGKKYEGGLVGAVVSLRGGNLNNSKDIEEAKKEIRQAGIKLQTNGNATVKIDGKVFVLPSITNELTAVMKPLAHATEYQSHASDEHRGVWETNVGALPYELVTKNSRVTGYRLKLTPAQLKGLGFNDDFIPLKTMEEYVRNNEVLGKVNKSTPISRYGQIPTEKVQETE